jgi:hypothetical protein
MKWPAAKVNRGDYGRAAREIDYDVVRDLSRIYVRTPPRGMAQVVPEQLTDIRSERPHAWRVATGTQNEAMQPGWERRSSECAKSWFETPGG